MPMILFVCTANRFRSPIAAASFRKELTTRKLAREWQVSSAGTWTTNGLSAAPEAIRGASKMGLDITGHTSRAISGLLMKEADLIIVMEQGQKEALCSEFPESAHKVHLFSEATSGVPYDIPDPNGSASGLEVPGEIDDLIHAGFDRICALVGKQ